MKTISYLRVVGFVLLTFFLLEFIIDSGEEWAFVTYPIIWFILIIIGFFAVAVELVIAAFKNVFFMGLPTDAKERFLVSEKLHEQNRFSWIKQKYTSLLDSKPMEAEQQIVLDHDYDGIRELDNNLPPWWKYMFYASIVFAFAYMIRYHIFDGVDQKLEYEMEVAQAQIEIEEFKKNNKDLIDFNTVVQLTEKSDLDAGKAVFTTNCIACHKADGGGGIGPNLTDDFWVLGGGIKNIFHTISEGGRAGKGMIAWKSDLKPSEIAQVASYIMTLHGTTPAEPKDPEGDLYKEETTSTESAASK